MVRRLTNTFLLYFIATAYCDQKIWNYDNDVMSPQNWETSDNSGCTGYIFPKFLDSIGSISSLKTEEILLPITGEIEIQNNAYIEFSHQDGKCVHVKQFASRRWLDPRNWKFPENSARPDAEKVPCVYDDVIFPNKDVAVLYPEVAVNVNSVKIKGVHITDDVEWQNFLSSDYGINQFRFQEIRGEIRVEDRMCPVRGCSCHDDPRMITWVCDGLPKMPVQCLQPIQPVGFCSPVCGGVVYLNIKSDFSMYFVEKHLPKEVDTYASLVLNWGKFVLQVVFMERSGYSELSAIAARDFYKNVLEDLSGFKVVNLTVKASGINIPLGSPSATAFGIIFGTFVAVVLIFAGIYLLHVSSFNVFHRVPFLGERSQYFFNKFDNKEMSRATSMISLEKAFDNPMYGAVPSTSTGSGITNQDPDPHIDQIENLHETLAD